MAAGARLIHVDVMDGHFVPPITIGPLVAGSIADQVHDAGGAIDVHLMIERPADQVAEFARAGADCITFHFEADAHAHRTLGRDPRGRLPGGHRAQPGDARRGGLRADRRRRPGPLHVGQPGLGRPAVHRLLARTRSRGCAAWRPAAVIEVDGGMDADTVGGVAEAGATLFVAGSAVFGDPSPAEAYRRIAAAAGAE